MKNHDDLETFDYIVVGAGTAGCVVASRLSEDPNVTVCLIEAGKKDNSVLIKAPAGCSVTVTTGLMGWSFDTVPQKGLNGRIGYQPRGKVLGGTSSINGMVYMRGNQWDFDNWAHLGNVGWSYKEILPYFKKSEHHECLNDEFHGQGGVLNVADLRSPSFFNDVFIDACTSQGIPFNPDPNGAQQYGSWRAQVTQKNGERCSAATAFIRPAMERSNLTILTKAHVAKLLIDETSSPKRITGVSLFVENDRKKTVNLKANREVVLSAGAYGSPQIMQLSGVGNENELEALGIDCVHHLPGVGENLQDHVTALSYYKTNSHRGTFGLSLLGGLDIFLSLLKWVGRRTGKITSGFSESGVFIKTSEEKLLPDIQIELLVAIVDDHGRKVHTGHGFTTHTTLARPKSRGSVKLASKDPFVPPLINPNYLAEKEDIDTLVVGLQKTLELTSSDPFKPYIKKMLYPVNNNDRNALEAYIRAHADTEYHPVGTCKMGPDNDPLAVVDEELKVKGLQGLRIIDASIMPEIPAANTSAATIMIGEKGADLLRGVKHAPGI